MAVNKKKLTDEYANKFYGQVVESAANTLTFEQIQVNMSFRERVGFILHRLEWYPSLASMILLVDAVDEIKMALVASQNISSLGLDNPAVIDSLTLNKHVATAVGFELYDRPFIRDFSMLPGGGMLIIPNTLFLAAQGTSLTAASSIECRAFYTPIDLDDTSYADIIDFYRILS